MESKWWYNPCDKGDYVEPPDVTPLMNWDLGYIKQKVDKILKQADAIKDDWAGKIFHKKFHEITVGETYPWLPQLPKEASGSVMKKKLPEQLLSELYSNFQTLAAGIHQLAREEECFGTDQTFQYTQVELKKLLSEMNRYMTDYNIILPTNVPPEVMPDELRDPALSSSEKDTRNFLILREYINCLQYFKQVIEYWETAQYNELADLRKSMKKMNV